MLVVGWSEVGGSGVVRVNGSCFFAVEMTLSVSALGVLQGGRRDWLKSMTKPIGLDTFDCTVRIGSRERRKFAEICGEDHTVWNITTLCVILWYWSSFHLRKFQFVTAGHACLVKPMILDNTSSGHCKIIKNEICILKIELILLH